MAWVGAILNALSCSDLYKYVFNSMRCKSDCCEHYLTCDCETSEVDLQSNDSEKLCCFGGNVESDTSDGPDLISNSEV
jgi:hypothetical protein